MGGVGVRDVGFCDGAVSRRDHHHVIWPKQPLPLPSPLLGAAYQSSSVKFLLQFFTAQDLLRIQYFHRSIKTKDFTSQ